MNQYDINHSKAYIREQWRKYGKSALHQDRFTASIASLRDQGIATRTFASGKVQFSMIVLAPEQVQFVRKVCSAGLTESIYEAAKAFFNENTALIEQWTNQLKTTA